MCTGTCDQNQALHDEMVMTLYLWIRATIPWHRVKYEPSAPYLLRNEYTSDECALIFHGSGTIATRGVAATLRLCIDKRNLATHEARVELDRECCVLRASLTHTLAQRKAASAGTSEHCTGQRKHAKTSQNSGVRPDISVMINSNPNKELWGDYCGVHDHSNSEDITNGTLNKLGRAETQGERLDNDRPSNGSAIPRKVEPATVIQHRTTMKMNKFSPLLDAATDAYKRGTRTCKPSMHPLIFSSLGTIGGDTLTFLHHIVNTAVVDHASGGIRRDGLGPSQKSRQLRDDLLYKLMLCHAKGIGSMLATSAGMVKFR